MTAFDDFRGDSSRDSLVALLRAHQDGVYTISLHVLRNTHDAEDAAQEALVKIAGGAADVRDPRAFKSWVYRVAYRTAVDHARRREARRRTEEGSVPMSSPPLSDAERDAIHEAMAALPDDDRLLLVEHYFEKATLDELGRREGVSDVAMGKRVEKAREKLRRGLAGAGFALGMAHVAQALESVTPAAGPSGLVGSAMTSKATLAAAGGTALGTKSTVGLLACLVLLLAVGGGFVLWRNRMPEESKSGTGMRRSDASTAPDPAFDSLAGPAFPSTESKGDLPACRKILARGLASLRSNDVHQFAFFFGWGDDRGAPAIDEFVRDFLASAGPDLVSISRSILAEARSDAMKFLITVALGRSGNVATLDLLKELAGDEAGVHIAAVAMHSIGRLRSADGLAFLRSEWKRNTLPLAPAILTAIGRHGSEGLAVLLAEAKSPRFESEVSYQGSPWSFSLSRGDVLAFARGPNLFEGLKAILESEEDRGLREGAARAMAHNFGPAQGEFLAAVLAKERSFTVPVINSLTGVENQTDLWESTRSLRSEFADRILSETPYPSGDPALDRALIRLAKVASPAKADPLFERFIALYPQMSNPELFWAVGEVIATYATRPDAGERIAAIVGSTQLSDEQRGLVTWVALQRAPPDVAAALRKPVLEILRGAHPQDTRFENSLTALIVARTDEATLSTALQEVYDRMGGAQDRALLLRESIRRVDRSGGTSVPRTFLESTLRRSTEVECVIYAAYGLFAAPNPMDPGLRERLAEWIGRDMRWAAQTPEVSYLPFVAPSVIGDYYSRFGTPKDIEWLETLPHTFPFPSTWGDRQRESVRRSLTQESRRAMDAIRLSR